MMFVSVNALILKYYMFGGGTVTSIVYFYWHMPLMFSL